jgi:hypothetical protein
MILPIHVTLKLLRSLIGCSRLGGLRVVRSIRTRDLTLNVEKGSASLADWNTSGGATFEKLMNIAKNRIFSCKTHRFARAGGHLNERA